VLYQLLVNKFPQLSFEEVLQMLDLKEVNLSETRFYQDVLQKGLEQGCEQEREQGLEQGLQREVVGGSPPVGNLVLRRLERRCGIVSIDYLR
jgi:predicted transposase YdaD